MAFSTASRRLPAGLPSLRLLARCVQPSCTDLFASSTSRYALVPVCSLYQYFVISVVLFPNRLASFQRFFASFCHRFPPSCPRSAWWFGQYRRLPLIFFKPSLSRRLPHEYVKKSLSIEAVPPAEKETICQ